MIYCSEIQAIEDEKVRVETYIKAVISKDILQDSLSTRISCKIPLSEKEKSSLFCLLSSHCRSKTRARLGRIIDFIPYVPNYGIFGRVLFENETASYCAGQSYPDEIRTVRECLIGR